MPQSLHQMGRQYTGEAAGKVSMEKTGREEKKKNKQETKNKMEKKKKAAKK
nr:hypothetical protein [Escherichia coli]